MDHLRVPFGLILNDDHLLDFDEYVHKKSRKHKIKKNKTSKNNIHKL